MEFPEDLYYTKEHTWAREEDEDKVIMGITDYLQRELGEISFIELPQVGGEVSQMEVIGSLESLRGVTEIYSPISGKILEVNEVLLDDPTIINEDPYGDGWVAIIEIEERKELNRLMDASDYSALVKREQEMMDPLEEDEIG